MSFIRPEAEALKKKGHHLKLCDGVLKNSQLSEKWKAYLMRQKRKLYGSVLHSLLRN